MCGIINTQVSLSKTKDSLSSSLKQLECDLILLKPNEHMSYELGNQTKNVILSEKQIPTPHQFLPKQRFWFGAGIEEQYKRNIFKT